MVRLLIFRLLWLLEISAIYKTARLVIFAESKHQKITVTT